MNSNNRIAATLYSLGTQFVSGIYVLIPCIKMMMIIITTIIITIIIIIKPRNYRQKPYWALHTYCGKY